MVQRKSDEDVYEGLVVAGIIDLSDPPQKKTLRDEYGDDWWGDAEITALAVA